MRLALMLEAIRTLEDAGVEPDIWKVEGLDRREDCKHLGGLRSRRTVNTCVPWAGGASRA
jgi:hypothetical protein